MGFLNHGLPQIHNPPHPPNNNTTPSAPPPPRFYQDAGGADPLTVANRNPTGHSGWGGDRDRPVRLFRSTLRYDERPVHEHVITNSEPGLLDEPLLHQPYAHLGEFFQKLGRYSRDWAAQNHARGKKVWLLSLLVRPQARFLTTLVLRGGWRDGWQGVAISALAAVSVASKYAHLWVLQHEAQGGARADGSWPS